MACLQAKLCLQSRQDMIVDLYGVVLAGDWFVVSHLTMAKQATSLGTVASSRAG